MSSKKAHAQKLPEEAAERLDRFGGEPLRAAFLVRCINALADLAGELDPSELGPAVASSSNTETLLSGLLRPEALEVLRARDPLAAARIRGLLARNRLLDEEGGMYGVSEVEELLRVSRQAVDKRRAAGTLLAIDVGRHGYRYPAWQFDKHGRTLDGLPEILALLDGQPAWAQVRFFLSSEDALGGERPLDALRRGEHEKVRRAARMFGEHGAA